MKSTLFLAILFFYSLSSYSQADRWQQRVEYDMDIDVDVEKHQYSGVQELTYYNNSPEDLDQVFYHLYFNAFQPGSMMDVRSRTIEDPDSRVSDRINNLTNDEQGWIKVKSLRMNGKKIEYTEVGTILEVNLPRAIKAGSKVVFEMEWDAQVPLQIRRSGWNNKEGIELSMSQWYPKMCEFDLEGWHTDPYVGREFYGVWGDFQVNISIDHRYTIGGTGVVQNADEVGHGYSDNDKSAKSGKIEWQFLAEDVHDFVWAADPDYVHDSRVMDNGTVLHFIYQDNPEFNESWIGLQDYTEKAYVYMSKHFGEYPYPQYTIIQGGDGGMEYPMATLITGNRSLRSIVGVSVHESAHSWYQGVIATNEGWYPWMDEGFTSYATSKTMDHLFTGSGYSPHHYSYQGYFSIVREGIEEALITHSDHFNTNSAYGNAAYSKGEVFLAQLGYVIGEENLGKALITYFDTWKFKHPNPRDFKRILERQSGLELDWYFQYFVNTTHTIDYAISQVFGQDGETQFVLEKKGNMPMPIDVFIEYRDGTSEWIYIPLEMMRGEKPLDKGQTVARDWSWTSPSYSYHIHKSISSIKSITIDPYNKMADTDKSNNSFILDENVNFIWEH